MGAPPSPWIVLSFGAGIAAGLARFPAPPLVFGLLLATAVLWRTRAQLLVGAAALGALHGGAEQQRAVMNCAARLGSVSGSRAVTVTLMEPARPGLVQARLPGCSGRITLHWPEGRPLPAGMEVAIEGRWLPRARALAAPDGLLLVQDIQAGPPQGTIADRVRGWITERAERLYGRRAPMVDALVLGRRAAMDTALKEAFARSGLVHLLSISGFHVGVIMTWITLLLRLARVPRSAASAMAAGVSVAYVAFLGWPAPATRAALLGVLLAWCVWRQRRVQPTPLLSATCFGVLLLDPRAIADLGAWLSASALWGATVFSRWSDAALGRRWAPQLFFASLGATLATAPLTAAVLGSVALAGLLLNFVGIPLAALAVPGILLSLVIDPLVPALAAPIAAGAGAALAGLERAALWGAELPGGVILTLPGWQAALPWLAVLLLARMICADQLPASVALRRAAWVAAFASALSTVGPWARVHVASERLRMEVLDVGQGDATILRTPRGRWIVVDAGPRTANRDVGARVVAPALRRHGAREIDLLVVSHAHLDHMGGAEALLEQFRVRRVMEPATHVGDPAYLEFLDGVLREGALWVPARAGQMWMVDGVRLRVLHPDTLWARWGEGVNEDSAVLLIEYGAFRAVFPGDAGLPVEARLGGSIGPVDLLKLGHHGSRSASSLAWLRELQPRAAAMSLGLNSYGHPHRELLTRLDSAGLSPWRTDREGTIRLSTDGREVEMRGRGRRERWVARVSAANR